MCLILFSYRSHPGYRMILAANRDEYYARPTRALSYWDDAPGVLAGRDLEAMGTWLGITRAGRFAAVTNFREGQKRKEGAPSRGRIVSDYLETRTPPGQYIETIDKRRDVYSGFNLLLGDRDGLYYYSNRTPHRPHGRSPGIRKLKPGVYGISNHLMDTPWPKVAIGKNMFRSIIEKEEKISTEAILEMLKDATAPPDEMLPDTGAGLAWERILSPLFITSPDYGTRSSSVVLVDRAGKVQFTERSYMPGPDGTAAFSTVEYELQIT
jgi:uncharacterized protein with NRDE domain